jgi:hypothetical protein
MDFFKKEDKVHLDYEQTICLLRFHYDYQNNNYGHIGNFQIKKFHNVGIDLLNNMVDTIIEIEEMSENLNFKRKEK